MAQLIIDTRIYKPNKNTCSMFDFAQSTLKNIRHRAFNHVMACSFPFSFFLHRNASEISYSVRYSDRVRER